MRIKCKICLSAKTLWRIQSEKQDFSGSFWILGNCRHPASTNWFQVTLFCSTCFTLWHHWVSAAKKAVQWTTITKRRKKGCLLLCSPDRNFLRKKLPFSRKRRRMITSESFCARNKKQTNNCKKSWTIKRNCDNGNLKTERQQALSTIGMMFHQTTTLISQTWNQRLKELWFDFELSQT